MSEQSINPMPVEPGNPVFDEPWQAQILAMADLLIQSKQISATDWASAFGEQLAKKQAIEDTLENYYHAALIALTKLMDTHQIISNKQLKLREKDWEKAYLSTPHGLPVSLK